MATTTADTRRITVLDPRGSWPDPGAYERQARRLKAMFEENFAHIGEADFGAG